MIMKNKMRLNELWVEFRTNKEARTFMRMLRNRPFRLDRYPQSNGKKYLVKSKQIGRTVILKPVIFCPLSLIFAKLKIHVNNNS